MKETIRSGTRNARYSLLTTAICAALALVCSQVPAASQGQAAEPAPAFLARRLCTVWAGQCQPYALTVGRLAAQCKTNSSVAWTIANERRIVLRCRGKDLLTNQPSELAFLFDAHGSGDKQFASITGISANGLTLSGADIVNLISNIDADLANQNRR